MLEAIPVGISGYSRPPELRDGSHPASIPVRFARWSTSNALISTSGKLTGTLAVYYDCSDCPPAPGVLAGDFLLIQLVAEYWPVLCCIDDPEPELLSEEIPLEASSSTDRWAVFPLDVSFKVPDVVKRLEDGTVSHKLGSVAVFLHWIRAYKEKERLWLQLSRAEGDQELQQWYQQNPPPVSIGSYIPGRGQGLLLQWNRPSAAAGTFTSYEPFPADQVAPELERAWADARRFNYVKWIQERVAQTGGRGGT